MAKRRSNEEFGTYIGDEVKNETGYAAFDFHMESPAFVAGRESRYSKNENVGHKQRSDLNE